MPLLSYFSKSAQLFLTVVAVFLLLRVNLLCRSTVHHRSAPTATGDSLFGLLWPLDAVTDALSSDNATTNSSQASLGSGELFSKVIVQECVSVPTFGKQRSVQPEAGVSQAAFDMFRQKADERLLPALILIVKAIVCIVHMFVFLANRTTKTSAYDYGFFFISLLLVGAALVFLMKMYIVWSAEWVLVEGLIMDYPADWKAALLVVILLLAVIIAEFIFRRLSSTSVRVVRRRRTYRTRRRSPQSAETDSLFGHPTIIGLRSPPPYTIQPNFSESQPAMAAQSSFNLSNTDSFRHPPSFSSTFLNTDTLPRNTEADEVVMPRGSPPPVRRFRHYNLHSRRTSSLSDANDRVVPPTLPEHRV
uniref:Integral membrane protein n=1 Tax=Panagrellus redivivus TaxID=6233 RepID=A0A7E4VA85_PANRE